ncbi:MAG: type II secretion system F family protein [Mycobacterium sp.]|jgi:tight adherence protein B
MTTLPLVTLLLAGALLVLPAHPRRVLFLSAPRRLPALPAVLAPAALGLLLAITSPPSLAVVGTAAAALLQLRRRRACRRRITRSEGDAMAAALETVVGELRVGAHPLRAFGIAASESQGAVGVALGTVTARVGLGADVVAGLRAVAEDSAVPFYWERIAVCWRLAAEHGLAMSTLMRAAQRDIVERQRFSSRVEAGLAGARATAAILAGLPVLGILFGQLISAHPMRFLLGGGIGGWLLVIGGGLIAAGVLWSDRIVDRLAI